MIPLWGLSPTAWLVFAVKDIIDRGVIGQGWAATHLPKFYAARAALDAGGKTNGG